VAAASWPALTLAAASKVLDHSWPTQASSTEFAKPALEALRQPLEDGRVAIVRARHSTVYPSRFMLVAATNPCRCGYAGEKERCRCTESDLAHYRRKLSGPLLDRIDLRVNLERTGREGLSAPPCTNSQQARERVIEARERQAHRLHGGAVTLNAHLDVQTLERYARPDEQGQQMLHNAHAQGMLSARGQNRTLRVARTIADLNGSERVRMHDVGVALALRPETGLHGSRDT
jgi:magnesium chelatase family protein